MWWDGTGGRGQGSESQRAEVRSQKAKVRKSKVRSQKSNVKRKTSNVKRQTSKSPLRLRSGQALSQRTRQGWGTRVLAAITWDQKRADECVRGYVSVLGLGARGYFLGAESGGGAGVATGGCFGVGFRAASARLRCWWRRSWDCWSEACFFIASSWHRLGEFGWPGGPRCQHTSQKRPDECVRGYVVLLGYVGWVTSSLIFLKASFWIPVC